MFSIAAVCSSVSASSMSRIYARVSHTLPFIADDHGRAQPYADMSYKSIVSTVMRAVLWPDVHCSPPSRPPNVYNSQSRAARMPRKLSNSSKFPYRKAPKRWATLNGTLIGLLIHLSVAFSLCRMLRHDWYLVSADLTTSRTRSSAYIGYECRKGLCSWSQCRPTGHCTVMPLMLDLQWNMPFKHGRLTWWRISRF